MNAHRERATPREVTVGAFQPRVERAQAHLCDVLCIGESA